ncbi:ribosomal protein S18 acetylase RimI-like enzyme [Roseovarius sp. MBR-78]|uniref:GNAT family N-acetyltransferase n=1 Tax=Roseovarius sp. MBR-78 TaxID=3156460 RepID=UPI003398FDFA
MIGFVTGGSGMGPIYRQMIRDWPNLIAALLPIMFQPRKVLGILEILRRRDKDDPGGDLPRHELFSIAVAPSARGTGVAERLYHRLTTHFLARNVPAFRIVVGESLTPAHRFYTRMGARPVATLRLHGDALSTVYVQITGAERSRSPRTQA